MNFSLGCTLAAFASAIVGSVAIYVASYELAALLYFSAFAWLLTPIERNITKDY